ncbi:MAG: MmcQ/YjbR family DNA-binding protein [Helicobacteraceae bacterium]|nr:MmcQ/YjbR family DNA-binding protein [Helicobacteraceae bacterium]
MNYAWLDEYCLSKRGATKDFKVEWDATRYLVGGKMFALLGDDRAGKAIVTLKLAPEEGKALRGRFKDITAGYYMNKEHWNSVYLDSEVPEDILREMIDKSHAIVFASLTKKAQTQIAQN